jgi:hypothetical protein
MARPILSQGPEGRVIDWRLGVPVNAPGAHRPPRQQLLGVLQLTVESALGNEP